MFVPKPHQDKANAALRTFFIELQRDDQEGATSALRRLYETIDVLDAQLQAHLEKPKAKPKFHPAHVKASKLQQTRKSGVASKTDKGGGDATSEDN